MQLLVQMLQAYYKFKYALHLQTPRFTNIATQACLHGSTCYTLPEVARTQSLKKMVQQLELVIITLMLGDVITGFTASRWQKHNLFSVNHNQCIKLANLVELLNVCVMHFSSMKQ